MLINTDFYHIKQFNTNTQCVHLLKKLFRKSTFLLNFSEYMYLNHAILNDHFRCHYYSSQSQKVLRGKINEFLILLYLQNHGLIFLYPQVRLFFIPDIKFDLVLFTQTKRIIAFNFKTSLRERYKQAVVEAQQVKKLDTRFEFYLLTNNLVESHRLNQKINHGKIAGINQVIDCFSSQANVFLQTLLTNHFIPFSDINIIKNPKGILKS